jgi:heme-degrading monooxygenase HmoA
MPEVAVLVKVRIHRDDVANLMEYRAKNVKALKSSPGFESLSIWESQSNKGWYLILIVYSDEAAADEGLKVSLGEGPLVAALKNVTTPPVVRRGPIEAHHGAKPTTLPDDAYLSLSVRVAGPGMGDDLFRELKRIFRELALIDGYLGSFTCRNSSLDEEAMGVAFWSSREAFETSLPAAKVHEVELFRRTI